MMPFVGCVEEDCKRPELEQDGTPCAESRYVTEACALDGDTIALTRDCNDVATDTERIRILGIDTPDRDGSSGPDAECYAEEAKDYLSSLLKRPRIRLDFDQECVGPYGRTLAHVVIEENCEDLLVSQLIVAKGYGTVYEFDDSIRHFDPLMAAQERAEADGTGLWSACY